MPPGESPSSSLFEDVMNHRELSRQLRRVIDRASKMVGWSAWSPDPGVDGPARCEEHGDHTGLHG
jgi:hypothetical protein